MEQSFPSVAQQGGSQAKGSLLIRSSSTSNWVHTHDALHKLIKDSQTHAAGREQLHKQGWCFLGDLGLVLGKQSSIIPSGKPCEQNG